MCLKGEPGYVDELTQYVFEIYASFTLEVCWGLRLCGIVKQDKHICLEGEPDYVDEMMQFMFKMYASFTSEKCWDCGYVETLSRTCTSALLKSRGVKG